MIRREPDSFLSRSNRLVTVSEVKMNPTMTYTTENTLHSSAATVQIPFLDLRAPYLELQNEIDDNIGHVLGGGSFILGKAVDIFEQEFAEYLGVKHCIGVGSGLDALHLAIRALGAGPGDEVLVPSNRSE